MIKIFLYIKIGNIKVLIIRLDIIINIKRHYLFIINPDIKLFFKNNIFIFRYIIIDQCAG